MAYGIRREERPNDGIGKESSDPQGDQVFKVSRNTEEATIESLPKMRRRGLGGQAR
jgi:hypothetical protein